MAEKEFTLQEVKESMTQENIPEARDSEKNIAARWAERVYVQLKRGSDINGDGVYVVVQLRSAKFPPRLHKSERLLSVYAPGKELRNMVEAMAGSLAEHQNTVYKDNHDPQEIARMALEVYDRLIREIEQRKLIIKA